MLPREMPNARILTYDWNANYKRGAARKRFVDHADFFLEELKANREKNVSSPLIQNLSLIICTLTHESKGRSNHPLIFVASCYGGLLLTKALVRAAHGSRNEYSSITDFTIGIEFLGTPFKGCWPVGYRIAHAHCRAAQNNEDRSSWELMQYLRPHAQIDANDGLEVYSASAVSELVEDFIKIITRKELRHLSVDSVFCFYEDQDSDVAARVRGLSDAQLAEAGIDRNHRGVVSSNHMMIASSEALTLV